MKETIVTLKIVYNEENYPSPSLWDFEQMLDLEPSETVQLLSIETKGE